MISKRFCHNLKHLNKNLMNKQQRNIMGCPTEMKTKFMSLGLFSTKQMPESNIFLYRIF